MYNQTETKAAIINPLIIVGMPRCGSTIFTRLLNESTDLLIINDFYYLQYVDSINGFRNNDDATKAKLAEYIEDWLIRRIKRPTSTGIGCGLMISNEQEAKIRSFLHNLDVRRLENWASILTEIMSFSANITNCKRWGYNTPQDYLNLDLLHKKFPRGKFIFMIRDPRSMLSSYKFMIKNKDNNNDSIRYHPILQSIAWRTSIRTFLDYQERNRDNILLVRYEDLVGNTKKVLSQVEKFTNASFPLLDVSDFSNNSSFKNKKRKNISDTETWLCEKIAGKEIKRLNYILSKKKPRLEDLKNLIFISARVTQYYLSSIITSVDTRKRVLKLVKKTFNLS